MIFFSSIQDYQTIAQKSYRWYIQLNSQKCHKLCIYSFYSPFFRGFSTFFSLYIYLQLCFPKIYFTGSKVNKRHPASDANGTVRSNFTKIGPSLFSPWQFKWCKHTLVWQYWGVLLFDQFWFYRKYSLPITVIACIFLKTHCKKSDNKIVVFFIFIFFIHFSKPCNRHIYFKHNIQE